MALSQGAPAPKSSAPHKAFSTTGANEVKSPTKATLAGTSAKDTSIEGSESGVSFRPAVSDKVNSKFKLPFRWLNDLGLSKLLSL